MERCSTPLVIREIQITTTMRYHFVSAQTAIVNRNSKTCWWRCGKFGIFIHCCWAYKMSQPLGRVWKFLKMLNWKLPYGPAIPPLDTCSREIKTYVHANACIWLFMAGLLITVKKVETIQVFINDECIKTKGCIYTTEYCLATEGMKYWHFISMSQHWKHAQWEKPDIQFYVSVPKDLTLCDRKLFSFGMLTFLIWKMGIIILISKGYYNISKWMQSA